MLKKITHIVLHCFFLIAWQSLANAQTHKIDSLKTAIWKAGTNEARMQAVLLLCEEKLSLNNDSLLQYANTAKQIAASLGNTLQVVRAEYFVLFYLQRLGLTDSVINQANKNIAWLRKNGGDKILEGNYLLLKGGALLRGNRYKEALDFYYTVLEKAEMESDTFLQIRAKNGIGWVNMEMGQNTEAINWFSMALSTSSNRFYYKKYNALHANISATYNNIGRLDSSIYYADIAISDAREMQELTGLANALNIKAGTLINLHKIAEAEDLLKQAIEIRKQTGGAFYTVSDLYQLSEFYAQTNQTDKGIATAKEGIRMAANNNIPAKYPILYAALANNYKVAGNYDKYAETLQTIIALKDSSYQKNSAEALADLQAKYDVQKKENTIIQQKLSIANRDYIIAGSVALLAMSGIATFVVYRNYRRRQKRKLAAIIKAQEDESAQAITEAEESQRKRIAAELHDNIGAQITYITSNIDWLVDSPVPLSKEEQQNRLLSVHDTSKEMMLNLRETIWALNSNEIKLDEFADKLKVYIQTVLRLHQSIQFQAEEAIEDNVNLNPLQALNMFRIFQEAVTNTFKHSNASQIVLQVKSKEKQFSIRIKDDGMGFKTSEIQGEHYGLKNMRYRAMETKLDLKIESTVGIGSMVEVNG